jgi:hypothetical protein
MFAVRAAAAALSLLVTTACSVQVGVGSGAPGPTPSQVPNLPSAIVVTHPAAPPGDFTAEQLTDALLGPDELAPGWTVGTSAINQDPQPTGCPPLDQLNTWPVTKVVVGFLSDGGRVQLVEGLSAAPTKNAREELRVARSVIDECLTITIRDTRGKAHTMDVSEPAFPRLGDETYSMRTGAPDVFYFHSVLIRRGGVLLTVGLMTLKPDSQLLEPFARRALAKVDMRLR